MGKESGFSLVMDREKIKEKIEHKNAMFISDIHPSAKIWDFYLIKNSLNHCLKI